MANSPQPPIKPPFRPRLVLAIAAFLPGVGQIMNNQPARGLLFAFTALLLGFITSKYAAPDASFVGRYAGGFFIHAIALMDAYRWAKVRWEIFHYRPDETRLD
ncbi:MAG TPA: hypothetical protein VFE34_13465 [Dongiaceae bacterium]|jgi:hypothetical protein|nr:hypothetical protein [Dongiaceae bacterium]